MRKFIPSVPLCVAMVGCTVCASMAVHAQDYSQSQVTAMAHNYFATDVAVATMANNVTIDTLYLGDTPKMFLCQDGSNWVVLTNEQSVSPIVCLGEGTLSVAELQESPLWLLLNESMLGLDSLRRSDDYEPAENAIALQSTARATKMTPLLNLNGANYWKQYNNNSNPTTDATKVYNKFCPDFYNCSNGKTYVGCTAVAMAQVMWYNKWPYSASIPSKIDVAGITSGTNVTRTYNWSNMPVTIQDNTPISQVDAIASLMRDCGYAGHTIYAKAGSSMTLTNAISALRKTFQYTAHMKQYSSGAKIFNNLVKSEIAAKRPVMIQATHASNGKAHTFVIDGYDSASEMFHLNMGWGGGSNTWYSVSGSDAYDHYTVARRMLYEIIPNKSKQMVMDYEDEIEENTLQENVSPINIQVEGNAISIQSDSDVQWTIYNIYGQSVSAGQSDYINITTLPMGTYTIIIYSNNTTNQIKFVK